MATIKISRGNDILYETYANAEGNITSLLSAIRTVQRESNVYLSKLVEEDKASNNNTGGNHGDGNGDEEEDDEDSEDDADRENKNTTIKVNTGKRRSSAKDSPNAKKSRSNQ